MFMKTNWCEYIVTSHMKSFYLMHIYFSVLHLNNPKIIGVKIIFQPIIHIYATIAEFS